MKFNFRETKILINNLLEELKKKYFYDFFS